jgi:hypothetical protein
MVYSERMGKGVGVGVAALLLVTACPGGGGSDEATGPTTTGDGTTAGEDITATTIPLPVDSSSDGGPSTASSSSEGGTSTGPGTTDSTGPTDSSSGSSSSGEPAESSSSDGGPVVYVVDWCVLQYPPTADVAVSEAFTVYVRLYAPGLTDQTGVTDPAPELVVEAGYGVDGSDPFLGVGAPWTWQAAMPNAGYGPGAPDYSANNDEYQHDLVIDVAGIYDYAARISGDSGATWVYCDLDGLTEGGYTPDQAGNAEVGQ